MLPACLKYKFDSEIQFSQAHFKTVKLILWAKDFSIKWRIYSKNSLAITSHLLSTQLDTAPQYSNKQTTKRPTQ